MRRLFHLLIAVVTSVSVLPALAAAQVIHVDPKSWDFGAMKQMETRTFTATITNKGGGLLKIGEVEADCGCTVPELQIKELPPGQSAPLKVEFNSKRFVGKVYKTVKIYSNDPSAPVTDIMITADVKASLVVDPAARRLGFGRLLEGETATRTATFTALEGSSLDLDVEQKQDSNFDVKVINHVDGDPLKGQIVATVHTDLPPGVHRENIRVLTNLEDSPTVDMELKADIFAPILASPERLNFRYRPVFKLNLRVRPFDKDTRFKITGVESDLPELNFGEIMETPSEFIIPINGKPISADDPRAVAAEGRIKGTITVHTDLPEMPVVTVPVTYMVRM